MAVETHVEMFVSHAQNFEDVLLRRALSDVEDGFYIDIGAQDPVIDSVSLGFYMLGWRGINVEPVAKYADALRRARPGDVVLEAAVGNSQEALVLYEFPDTGLSTGDRDIALRHVEKGLTFQEKRVSPISLADILDNCGKENVHWMKIDVEGMERDVLTSWSDSPVRPWIVVIESTIPNSTIPNHENWENLIIDRGYSSVYFDGLSRFYLSAEKSHLKRFFGPGVNLFDEFEISVDSHAPGTRALRSALQHTRNEMSQISVDRDNLRGDLEGLRAEQAGLVADKERIAAELSASRGECERLASERAALVADNERVAAELSASRAECERFASERVVLVADNERVAAELSAIQRECERLVAEQSALQARHAVQQAEIDRLLDIERLFVAVRGSTSWRLGAPLRALMRASRGDFRSFRHAGHVSVARGVAVVRQSPRLKSVALALLALSPSLRDRVMGIVESRHAAHGALAAEAGRAAPSFTLQVEPERLAEWRRLVRTGGLRQEPS